MMTEIMRNDRGARVRLAIRILAFAAGAIIVPAINLGAIALGWAVFWEDQGRDGIRTAAIWTVIALAVNFILWGVVIGTRF